MKKQVKLYTWAYCPFCRRATMLLDLRDIPYVEIGIDGDSETFEKLAEETGQRTVPFIFIKDTFIGGYDQLKALDDQKKLEKMLS